VAMGGHPELDAMARRVIDANQYMVLGTRDPDGSPRLSPCTTPLPGTGLLLGLLTRGEPLPQPHRAPRSRDRDLRLHGPYRQRGGRLSGHHGRTDTRRPVGDGVSRGVQDHRRRSAVPPRRTARRCASPSIRGSRRVMRGPCARRSSGPWTWRGHSPAGRPDLGVSRRDRPRGTRAARTKSHGRSGRETSVSRATRTRPVAVERARSGRNTRAPRRLSTSS
jgi:hypothetical protein